MPPRTNQNPGSSARLLGLEGLKGQFQLTGSKPGTFLGVVVGVTYRRGEMTADPVATVPPSRSVAPHALGFWGTILLLLSLGGFGATAENDFDLVSQLWHIPVSPKTRAVGALRLSDPIPSHPFFLFPVPTLRPLSLL